MEVDPDKKVGDYMTKEVKSFDVASTVLDICAHLAVSGHKRVPILKEGKLVGIISRRDVIREIMRLRGRGPQ